MRKTINNKWLLIIFAVLLLLVVLLFSKNEGHKERSFDKQLVSFVNDDIIKIILFPKNLQGESIELEKMENSWQVKSGDETHKAGQSNIDGMLNSLADLKALSLAANSKDRWETYEVNDSLATRVQLFNNNNKKVADVYIGKFMFKQPRSMSTYVRLNGKKETYRVEGFLSSTFNRTVNDLRDKTITRDPIANWRKLLFDYPADSSFVLAKEQGQWMINGVLANQDEVTGYINSIKNQSGITIYEGNAIPGYPKYRLTIERENLDPVVVSVAETDGLLLLTSSENEGIWYSDQSVTDRFIVPKSKFEIR